MKDIKYNTIINCQTEEETISVFNILKEKGFDSSFNSGKDYWKKHLNKLCFRIDGIFIQFANIEFYKECFDENILTAKEFLKKYMEEEEKNIKITLTKAQEMYPTACKDMKILLEATFPELITPNYPTTYSELQVSLYKKSTKVYDIKWNLEIYDVKLRHPEEQIRSIILTEKRAKEQLAFLQVIALMDYYNQLDEFIPNWNNGNENKYCIINDSDRIITATFVLSRKILTFKTAKTRDLFFKNFKDLIEQCKNLI